MIKRRTFLLLGIVTLFGFGGIGWAVMYFFQEQTLREALILDKPLFFQVTFGLGYGIFAALAGWWLIQRKFMEPVKNFYSGLMKNIRLNFLDVLFISFCAGVGEEILFRGAIQPFLGIWITAILFVAIHGYLNPMNWRLSIYGILMTFIIAGLGWMRDHWGLIAPMSAHFAIDVVLLHGLISREQGGNNADNDGSVDEEEFDLE